MICNKIIATVFLCAAITACTSSTDQPTDHLGSAQISNANGHPIGTANLKARGDSVSLTMSVSGIEPGEHGFHLHQTGLCQLPDFKSASGHLNPNSKDHGLETATGSHLGDLPNLLVGANGSASTTVAIHGSRRFIMESLYDNDGTAVVIHAKPDDYRTNPSGAAGPRIACGVISRPKL